ncbi:MAG: ACP S-malonyltransferase [Candidatus Aminicenantia bacterium]
MNSEEIKHRKEVAFLFPGQGSQTVGMGADLWENFEEARILFREADKVLGYSLSEIVFKGPEDVLKLTENTQPALLVHSYILFRLLNFFPSISAGHSLGEYSALLCSGVISFEDAVRVVHKRGKFMQEAVPVGKGAMAAILGANLKDIEIACKNAEGIVEIANINSHEQVVISGAKEAVEKAISILKPPKFFILPVSAPFHCVLMRPAEEKLSKELDSIKFFDPCFPIITNADAKSVNKGEEAREALKRQVSRPVRWLESMELMLKMNISVFVEIGSGKVLSGLLKRIARNNNKEVEILNVDGVESLKKAKEILLSL